MSTGDLAPDATELRAGLSSLGSVDVSNLLSDVEINGLLVVASLNLEKVGVVVGVSAASVSLIIICIL